MKKQTRLFLIIFAVCSLLTVPVNAHSGRTDVHGGHYDGGDYHYHHGYSAHDHYDMDGDGDIDCPYDFRNNVDHDRGESYSGSTSSDRSTKTTSEKKPKSWSEIIKIIGSILLGLFYVFCIPILSIVISILRKIVVFVKDSVMDFICWIKSR